MDCLYHQTHQNHPGIPFCDIWNYIYGAVLDRWVYLQIVTVPASPTLYKDVPDETLDT